MQSSAKRQKGAFLIFIFIAVEILLYLTYMYMDIMIASNKIAADSTLAALMRTGVFSPIYIKYYSIILCLIISVIYYYKKRSKDGINEYSLLVGAIFFTAVSDYFLLIKNDYLVPGLISFCIVHGIYLFVITCKDIKNTAIYTAARIGAALVITIILNAAGVIRYSNDSAMNAVLFLAILYGISFVWNILLLAVKIINHNTDRTQENTKVCEFPHPVMFLIGLLLFLICDINVLIFNLGSYISINSETFVILQNASTILMWTFYLPSQVLIVLSVLL